MADKREQILERIVEIAKTIPGIKTVKRNEVKTERKEHPAAILLDGDEEVYTSPRVPSPVLAPQIMRMRFGLFITIKDVRPAPGPTDNPGSALNSFRIAAIKLLKDDPELRTLLGTNGALEYTGITTDLNAGSAVAGEMNLGFRCNYYFDPSAA